MNCLRARVPGRALAMTAFALAMASRVPAGPVRVGFAACGASSGVRGLASSTMLLLAEAVRTVGADRAAVRQFLAGPGRSRPPYEGVTGPISFGPNRSINLVMTRLDSGSAVSVDFR